MKSPRLARRARARPARGYVSGSARTRDTANGRNGGDLEWPATCTLLEERRRDTPCPLLSSLLSTRRSSTEGRSAKSHPGGDSSSSPQDDEIGPKGPSTPIGPVHLRATSLSQFSTVSGGIRRLEDRERVFPTGTRTVRKPLRHSDASRSVGSPVCRKAGRSRHLIR